MERNINMDYLLTELNNPTSKLAEFFGELACQYAFVMMNKVNYLYNRQNACKEKIAQGQTIIGFLNTLLKTEGSQSLIGYEFDMEYGYIDLTIGNQKISFKADQINYDELIKTLRWVFNKCFNESLSFANKKETIQETIDSLVHQANTRPFRIGSKKILRQADEKKQELKTVEEVVQCRKEDMNIIKDILNNEEDYEIPFREIIGYIVQEYYAKVELKELNAQIKQLDVHEIDEDVMSRALQNLVSSGFINEENMQTIFQLLDEVEEKGLKGEYEGLDQKRSIMKCFDKVVEWFVQNKYQQNDATLKLTKKEEN